MRGLLGRGGNNRRESDTGVMKAEGWVTWKGSSKVGGMRKSRGEMSKKMS